MFTPANTKCPDLNWFDLIVVNSSAGKDSQASLTTIDWHMRQQDVPRSKLLVVHCDLGRVEWPGTRELAEEQAQHYEARFLAVKRPQGDLLHQIEHERRAYPSRNNRYCTSDQKTKQVLKVFTAEVRRLEAELDRPVRILNVLGIRASESPKRKKDVLKMVVQHPDGMALANDKASNGKRAVYRFYPIAQWSKDEVWACIRASGVRYHPAYDAGFARLSCTFCVLVDNIGLHARAATMRPELAQAYADVEQRLKAGGAPFWRFHENFTMGEVIEASKKLTVIQPQQQRPEELQEWCA